MLSFSITKNFKKDIKRCEKRQKNMAKIKSVMDLLICEMEIPVKMLDHSLQGEYHDCRELHIENDWLLIYRVENNHIEFIGTGTHSDLFR